MTTGTPVVALRCTMCGTKRLYPTSAGTCVCGGRLARGPETDRPKAAYCRRPACIDAAMGADKVTHLRGACR